jgi:hypothetical protein
MAMSLFVLPRTLGRPATDPVDGRRALTVICAGITVTYLVYFTVGMVESIAIHNGATPLEARQAIAGPWGRYVLFVGAQALLGLGYILLFRHIARAIGRETIRAYFGAFRDRIGNASREAIRVHNRALPATYAEGQRKALVSGMMEALGGAAGFMGMGWLYSGRPFIGIMLLGSWGGGFWTFAYVVLAVAGGANLIPVLLVPWIVIPVLSGIGCYRSYLRDARMMRET